MQDVFIVLEEMVMANEPNDRVTTPYVCARCRSEQTVWINSCPHAPATHEATQSTEWPHPMTPRTVVSESADKTPRPEHTPFKPKAQPVEQLRQQIGKEMLAHQTAEKCAIGLQQQLAQIRAYKGERPHSYIASHYADSHLVCSATEVNKLLVAQDATIAALRLDNAQKAERIAELEGGKK